MIHLIYTSVPLETMGEAEKNALLRAVDHWSKNHSFYENEPSPNFQVRFIKTVYEDHQENRIEWRRIFNRVLHIPDVFGECCLYYHGFSPWFKYVQDVAVATDVQFRKNGVSRFSSVNENVSSIREVQDEDGLNRIQLHITHPHSERHRFVGDIEWLQGFVPFFLETAAIYHMADQAWNMGQGNLGNPRMAMMCEKLGRIKNICDLSDTLLTRHKE